MGVPPSEHGKLYHFQIESIKKEYYELQKFQAQVAGAKIK